MLYTGLAATGVLGTPLEYFNPGTRVEMSERWGCGPDLESYVEALHARRTTAEGLFAAKIHWEHFVEIRAEAGVGSPDRLRHDTPAEFLDWLFPGAVFVRIVRLDLDRQAVSQWRATESNIWSVAADDDATPTRMLTPYSFEGIDYWRREIANGELGWQHLLLSLGRESVLVVYEDLCADFAATIERVASHVVPGVAIAPQEPRTRRLRDLRSEAFLARYQDHRQRNSR
jgi:LPS sulfotransferase NodH